MKKTYTAPIFSATAVLTSDVITMSLGLATGDLDDAGSIGNTKSVLGFEEI